jgi:hypothetical protein
MAIPQKSDISESVEPRWPAVLSLIAVGGLYLALPSPLTPGPNWLLLVVLTTLLVPSTFFHKSGRHRANEHLGYLLSSLITLALLWSLGALIAGLPAHRESPTALLRSAGALWAANILVFASWYWRLDAGGPHQRDLRGSHSEGAFLFPQMIAHLAGSTRQPWRPGFVDYLFLAFNTSTAFSPTDVSPLTQWAKLLMMIQSVMSLGTIAILSARAVNIL